MDKLKRLQKTELEILLEFQRICHKYALQYYLVAGSLLGAVRHQGFIPWDDDIDVAMPRKDFKKFKAVCKSELPEPYFYQDYKTDPNFFPCYAKLRKSGTQMPEENFAGISLHNGIFIDIFPLDKCPLNKNAAKFFFKVIGLLDRALQSHIGVKFCCGYTKRAAIIACRLLALLPKQILYAIRACAIGLINCLPCKRLCTVGGGYGYPRETYDTDWFGLPAILPFEEHPFPVPKEFDKVLKNMYGDYMTFPDAALRKPHADISRVFFVKESHL